MLLPKDIIDNLYYYHSDYCKESNTDKITVVYQGWLFKKTKKFNFTRGSQISEDGQYTTYTMIDECNELINQLHNAMKENLKKDDYNDKNEE